VNTRKANGLSDDTGISTASSLGGAAAGALLGSGCREYGGIWDDCKGTNESDVGKAEDGGGEGFLGRAKIGACLMDILEGNSGS